MSRKFVQEYFNFSTREKKGLVLLFMILFALITTNFFIAGQKKQQSIDFSEFEKEIDRFSEVKTEEEIYIELFEFDPNTASKEELEKLGLRDNVVNNIINYRNSGGRFFNKHSLSRIYGLCEDEFNRIKEYVVIENQISGEETKRETRETQVAIEKFNFNPNTASEQDLLKLGLTSRQTNNLIRYRNNGGRFYDPEDIMKIYGINENDFVELKDFIVLESHETSLQETELTNEIQQVLIKINSADQYELQKISGIGPVFSERIINYRERLGGFYEKNQLIEVWGIDEELINNISNQIKIDLNNIKKVNINEVEYRDLIRHPYLDRKTTTSIMEYKRFAGRINNIEELWQQRVIERDIYDKIKWYIAVYED